MVMLECQSSHIDFVKLGVMILCNIYHICPSAATLPAVVVVATLLLLNALWFLVGLWATTAPTAWPPVALQPHPEHTESLAGQEDLPGACDFVQLLHACWAVLVGWDFCSWCCCCWHCYFWWQIALTVFEPVRAIAFMLSEMTVCVWHNSSISEVVAVNFRARSLQTNLNQIGHGQSDNVYSFLLFIGGKTASVSEAADAFYKLIRGFTLMYMDIFQLIDSPSLKHGVIHCGGEVFEECSSTFLLTFMVSFSGTLWFPLLMFPLASVYYTIVRLFLHSLKVIPAFHRSAEEMKILILFSCLPVECGRFQCFSWSTGTEGLEGLS